MKTQLIRTLTYSLMLVIAVALFNCKGKQGDPGPDGPALSGSINGVLSLTTSTGTLPTDLSGVTVKTNKGDSAVTNTAGVWTLNETTGIYTLTFTKSGYGPTIVNGYSYVGGSAAYLNTVALSQTPNFTVGFATPALDTIGANSTATKDLHINVNLTIGGTVPEQDLEVFVYYSTNSGVSSTNYMGMSVITVPAGQATYKGSITGANLLAAQIETGDIVYMIAYPSSAPTALSSKYVNESTGKTVYTALGAASVVENIKVPQ